MNVHSANGRKAQDRPEKRRQGQALADKRGRERGVSDKRRDKRGRERGVADTGVAKKHEFGRELADKRGRERGVSDKRGDKRGRERGVSDKRGDKRGRERGVAHSGVAEKREVGRELADQRDVAAPRGRERGVTAGGVAEKREVGRELADKRGRGRPLVDDKRRIILDAAMRVFAAKGYHGTTVPDVADAAGVGTGTLYRYFANKEGLVNEVYRDAKVRLRTALMEDLDEPDMMEPGDAKLWFQELWYRLGAFARAQPEAFRFLEMQDHVEYLDVKSRQLELSVLMPLWMAGKRLHARDAQAPVDMLIALLWGAFVGLVKASRLGYLALDDKRLAQAGTVCWRLIEPNALKQRTSRTKG